MFTPQHCGIYFTDEHISQARQQRDREPFKSAWAYLRESQPDDGLAAVLRAGLCCRFADDHQAGEAAVHQLMEGIGLYLREGMAYFDVLKMLLAAVQCFEMVRDHGAFSQAARRQWLEVFLEHVDRLNPLPEEASYLEYIWLGTLNVAAGVALEHETLFQAGVDVFYQVVHDDIHPEGYIPRALENRDGLTLHRQLLAVQGLALTAEAASHAGVRLWAYHNRGVSVMTAATYLMYYYYYPEKWPWEEGQQLEATRTLFRQNGGFLEMANRFAGSNKTLKPILEDLRPIDDLYGGGLTTLTHGLPARRGLFG